MLNGIKPVLVMLMDIIPLYIGTDGPLFQKPQMILVWKSEGRAYINENLNLM